jgi:hypothetical protein
MKRAITTVVTADYYQLYIPIFVWSVLKTWRDVDIIIYLRGELDKITLKAMNVVNNSLYNNAYVIENYKTDYPYQIGTTNALRYTTEPLKDYDEVLVTDIDFFFTEMPMDIFKWFRDNRECECFSGLHGPWYKPPRPEICKSWHGEFQRVAGGFFVIYPGWWEKTKELRETYDSLLYTGHSGNFRENDEVILYRMIRDANLPVPKKVPLPRFLRHLHLGDFKPEMKTRYEDMNKMRRLLDPRVVNAFLSAKSYPVFAKILDIVSENKQIKGIIDRATEYCENSRGN